MEPSYYLTTPIYYVNAEPHVGHAYTTIAADALTRARRLRGRSAFLLTGTDEHGQNIERIARERGVPEQQHCDEYAARFRALWQRLDIAYDRFIRTTDDVHKRGVLKLWERLLAAKCPDGRDAVYLGKYSGWYCPRCEGFKDEEELGQPGNVCPDHERPCEWTEEENYFFRLSAYAGWLRAEIEADRIRIRPDVRRNEVLSLIGQGLKDFSASRARVHWGIPVPQQPDHVLYVWIDALSNYVTALGYADGSPDYERLWAGGFERMHLIGKDIIRFHCLYWPAVLHAAGLLAPNRLFVQGHITKNGRKLSKTTGNVIDPEALVSRWGSDAVRYFLLREGVYGHDWDWTDNAFVTRYNADLANDLGNLVSRALTMVARYCDGRVPARPAVGEARSAAGEAGGVPPFEVELQDATALEGRVSAVLDTYEALDFSGTLAEIWAWVSHLNQRIVAVSPWLLAKDPARRAELDAFLYRLLEAVRLAAVLVSPVVPRAATRVLQMFGLPGGAIGSDDLKWGRLQPGQPLGTIEALFPRAERGEGAAAAQPASAVAAAKETSLSDTKPTEPQPAVPPAPPAGAPPPTPAAAPAERIDISDFARVELRVAKVVAAEKVPSSKKLLKLQLDLGSETRQVVAGIAEVYAPEALVGRTVAMVANLKPAKLMGVESNGMILAASIDGRPVLCAFDGDVPPGTRIK